MVPSLKLCYPTIQIRGSGESLIIFIMNNYITLISAFQSRSRDTIWRPLGKLRLFRLGPAIRAVNSTATSTAAVAVDSTLLRLFSPPAPSSRLRRRDVRPLPPAFTRPTFRTFPILPKSSFSAPSAKVPRSSARSPTSRAVVITASSGLPRRRRRRRRRQRREAATSRAMSTGK